MAPRAADRGGDAARAGELVAGLFGTAGGRALSAAQQAAKAWYAANGDRERQHTTGVWLRKAGRAGQDPVLVVELDANWLAGELATNKELYLSRLSFRGIRVSDIRFQVGRGTGEKTGNVSRETRKQKSKTPHSPISLSAEEEARVERACEGLPDGLRQSVSRAMCASLVRSHEDAQRDSQPT